MEHPLYSFSKEDLTKLIEYYRVQLKNKMVTIDYKEIRNYFLYIINYTDKYNETSPQDWDHRMKFARGLLLGQDELNNLSILGYCIPKFFSYHYQESNPNPNDIVKFMPKYDGTCLFITYHMQEIITWTRKSFNSPQATKLVWDFLTKDDINIIMKHENWTFVFELVHPNDSKVQFSRKFGMFILYVVDSSGKIMSDEIKMQLGTKFGPNINAVTCTEISWSQLLSKVNTPAISICDIKEGYVVKNMAGVLMKIKTPQYLFLANNRPTIIQPSKETLKKIVKESLSFDDIVYSPFATPDGVNADEVMAKIIQVLGQSVVDSMYNEWQKLVTQLNIDIDEVLTNCEFHISSKLSDNNRPSCDVVPWLRKTLGPMKKTLGCCHVIIMNHVLNILPEDLLENEKRSKFFNTNSAVRLAAAKLKV